MRKRNRRNAPEAPEQAPVAAPVPVDELRALTDRLAALEAERQAAAEPWSPHGERRRAEAAALARFIRHDHPEACAACGRRGGEQRKTAATLVLASSWVCVPCSEAIMEGWGTRSTRMFTMGQTLDRLASLAAGQAAPTPGLRVLAARYGLSFQLAKHSSDGDGTAWGHLGDRSRWLEVGVKATRRAQAGFGVHPAPGYNPLVPEELELVHGFDPVRGHPRLGTAPKPRHVSPEQVAAQLAAEESAIEAELKAQRRRAKEREAEAARKDREREIRVHHREHAARLEAEIKRQRAALRGDLTAALSAHAARGM